MTDDTLKTLILTDNTLEGEDLSQMMDELGHGPALIVRTGAAGIAAISAADADWSLAIMGLSGLDPQFDNCATCLADANIPSIFINGSGTQWQRADAVRIARPYIPADVEGALLRLQK